MAIGGTHFSGKCNIELTPLTTELPPCSLGIETAQTHTYLTMADLTCRFCDYIDYACGGIRAKKCRSGTAYDLYPINHARRQPFPENPETPHQILE
jgi:hypothetical protein